MSSTGPMNYARLAKLCWASHLRANRTFTAYKISSLQHLKNQASKIPGELFAFVDCIAKRQNFTSNEAKFQAPLTPGPFTKIAITSNIQNSWELDKLYHKILGQFSLHVDIFQKLIFHSKLHICL